MLWAERLVFSMIDFCSLSFKHTVRTCNQNIAGIELYLLDLDIWRNILYESKDVAFTLNLHDVVVSPVEEEEGRNRTVDVVDGVIAEINQGEKAFVVINISGANGTAAVRIRAKEGQGTGVELVNGSATIEVRYLASGENQPIIPERLDCFAMDDNYIYYAFSDPNTPSLKRCTLTGGDTVVLFDGIVNSINLSSKYLYFKVYGLDDVMYHMPLNGSSPASIFVSAY